MVFPGFLRVFVLLFCASVVLARCTCPWLQQTTLPLRLSVWHWCSGLLIICSALCFTCCAFFFLKSSVSAALQVHYSSGLSACKLTTLGLASTAQLSQLLWVVSHCLPATFHTPSHVFSTKSVPASLPFSTFNQSPTKHERGGGEGVWGASNAEMDYCL